MLRTVYRVSQSSARKRGGQGQSEGEAQGRVKDKALILCDSSVVSITNRVYASFTERPTVVSRRPLGTLDDILL